MKTLTQEWWHLWYVYLKRSNSLWKQFKSLWYLGVFVISSGWISWGDRCWRTGDATRAIVWGMNHVKHPFPTTTLGISHFKFLLLPTIKGNKAPSHHWCKDSFRQCCCDLWSETIPHSSLNTGGFIVKCQAWLGEVCVVGRYVVNCGLCVFKQNSYYKGWQ